MGYSRKPGSAALPKPHSTPSPSLAEFGGAFENTGGAVGDTQVVAQGPNLINWIGSSADAYTAESLDIQDRAVRLQGILTTISAELRGYGEVFQALADTTIPDYQQQWDEAISTHDENVEATKAEREAARAQTPPDQTFDDSSFRAEIQRQHDLLEEAQGELARLYNAAVCDVDDAAGETASAIAAALDGLVPRGADGGLPSRADVGHSLFGDSDGILAAQQHMERASADAEDAAALLADIGEEGFPTEEAIREFNDTYGERLANDPFFAAAFFANTSADDFYSYITRVGQYPDHLSDDYRAELEESLGYFGAGLTLATGGTNAGYETWDAWEASEFGASFSVGEHGSLADWRDSFQADLIAGGRSFWDPNGDSGDELQRGMPGYSALLQAMALGHEVNPDLALGDSFLNGTTSVAHDLIAWDQETNYNWQTAGVGFPPLLYRPGDEMVIDPVQNMLSLIDGESAAAQTWLTSDTRFEFDHDHDRDTDPVSMDMTRYLVGYRPINHLTGENWIDQGETLGELLDEATRLDPTSQSSTEIAYNFLLGYTDGLAVDNDTFWFGNQDFRDGQDVFGYNNSGLRSYAGEILDDYMDVIANSIANPGGDTGVIQNPGVPGEYMFVMDDELRDRLIGKNGFFTDLAFHTPEQNEDGSWVGGRPPATQTLIERSMAEFNLDLIDALGEDGSSAQMTEAMHDWGFTLEFLTTSPADATTQQGAAMDAQNQMLHSLVSRGVGMIPFSEILTDPGHKYVHGQVKNWGILDAGLEALLPTDNEARGKNAEIESHNATEVLVRDIFMSAIAQNTEWGEPSPVETMFGPDSANADLQILDSDGSFIPYSEMSIEQRMSFDEWVKDSNWGEGGSFNGHFNDMVTILNDAQQEAEEAGS